MRDELTTEPRQLIVPALTLVSIFHCGALASSPLPVLLYLVRKPHHYQYYYQSNSTESFSMDVLGERLH